MLVDKAVRVWYAGQGENQTSRLLDDDGKAIDKPVPVEELVGEDAMTHLYALTKGRWNVGPEWELELAYNDVWYVIVRYKRPLCSVIVPDYVPPKPKVGLWAVK